MAERKGKKIVSWIIDGVLVALIGVLVYVQISMLTTKGDNHGVPKAFGMSFLYVATNSMDDPDQPNGIHTGSGILIESVKDYASLKVSDPIYDEEGNLTDYAKNGDVVTFYYDAIRAADTHRLIDKNFNEETGKWEFKTKGDNPEAHKSPYLNVEVWGQDDLIGKVVYHSDWLGGLLTIASPDAAASAGKTAWLLPVAVLVPLVVLAGMSIFDVFKKAKAEEREEEARMLEAMVAAGVDPNDEEAAELFRQKEELKIEYRAKMEEELEKAKREARKKAASKKKGDRS